MQITGNSQRYLIYHGDSIESGCPGLTSHVETVIRAGHLVGIEAKRMQTFLTAGTSGRDGDLADAASRGSRTSLADQTCGRDVDLADAASRGSRTFLADQTSGRDGNLAGTASRVSRTFLGGSDFLSRWGSG
ncbi:hypothetical protein DPMN_052696 [Dreissena polymorpha]|uniref:Uncharacterized protein n=1 Tax=Dreissena polymorpha TaxID=45954 RepID=A0A9D4CLC8_DREPO|nr:hypothetical protein DPMN_052696 [Dreissena polymorpha]